MNTKPRICLVIPSLKSGGMERVMSELAGYFCGNREIEVYLVLYGIDPDIFFSVPENLIIHKPNKSFDNSKRMLSTINRISYLRRTVKKINPQTILSFGEYWNSFVLLATLGLGYPVYVSDRCQPDKSLGKFHDILRTWLYPKASGIIAQTRIARDIYLKQFHHNNIQVVGNPIRHIENNNKIIEKENVILNVGRLIDTKHQDLLIDIFCRLNVSDWKLVIVGGDAIRQKGMERLKVKIKKLNLEDRIILTGNISNVDEYYLKSKIFAFTSSSEGFPNAIGEAMSAGLPVIAFDCIAGPSEMIKSGENGYLVPVFDEKAFQNKLQLLIDDEKLRRKMSNTAMKSIEQFSINIIGEGFLKVILS